MAQSVERKKMKKTFQELWPSNLGNSHGITGSEEIKEMNQKVSQKQTTNF